jgi:hypothetical protein
MASLSFDDVAAAWAHAAVFHLAPLIDRNNILIWNGQGVESPNEIRFGGRAGPNQYEQTLKFYRRVDRKR